MAIEIYTRINGIEQKASAFLRVNGVEVPFVSNNVAFAGIDESGHTGTTRTLVGIPAGGAWTQISGDPVDLSPPVNVNDTTQVSFSRGNESTSNSAERVFRYTVYV